MAPNKRIELDQTFPSKRYPQEKKKKIQKMFVQTLHQFSQTSFETTCLMTAQCPRALCWCHFTNLSVSFLRRIPSSPPARKSLSVTSCLGLRKASRDGLFKTSLAFGSRKVIPSVSFVQNMTIFVKSLPSLSRAASSRGCSRKMRQDGKTSLIVCTTTAGGGSVKSPA